MCAVTALKAGQRRNPYLISGKGKIFSALRGAQTSSGVHSASYSINTGTVGSGLKQLVHEADRSNYSSAYTFPNAFRPCTRKILPLSRTWHVVTSLFMRKCKKRNLHNILVLRYAFSLDKIFIYLLFYWRTPILPQVS